MRVRLTKVSGKPDSSIQPGYWVKGMIGVWPEVGTRVLMERPVATSLNEWFDWFSTTTIVDITEKMDGGTFLHTKNSVWRIERI